MSQEERVIGIWRRSRLTWGFWYRVIITLGIYWFTLWRMNQITVTTRRVTQRLGGLLGGREISVRIDRINDVTIDTPPMGAIFNWGNVKIETTGSNEEDTEINHHGLANPKHLREVIFDLQDGKLNNRQ